MAASSGVLEHAYLYRFLARAYLAPPDRDLLAMASEVPELFPFLGEDFADRHTWLFAFNIYPYASVYLDPSGMLDAPWSGFVSGVYRALGFEVAPGAGLAAPDHLAALLEAMSVLLEREGEADDDLAAERSRHGQRTLLAEHIAPWLPSFLPAICRVDRGFYAALAGLTQEVVLDHARELFGGPDTVPASPSVLEPSAEASPGLQRLLFRALSGLYLSRADLTGLGLHLALPVRFAERRFMLDHLVRGAAEREQLGSLLDALGAQVAEQRSEFTAWAHSAPMLEPVWRPWILRLDATGTWLAELAVDSAELQWRVDGPGGGASAP